MTAPPSFALARVPAVFAPLTETLLAQAGFGPGRELDSGFHLLKPPAGGIPDLSAPVRAMLPWVLPVHHAWPCAPRSLDGFMEKAAQALAAKFAAHPGLQGVFCGSLHPGSPDRYWKSLASNLRGRLLQLFPALPCSDAATQDPDADSLFVLTGKSGLFAGVCPPRIAGGFHPGGTVFIRQDPKVSISRAGAKIVEALHWLRLHRPPPPPESRWLELGASPGGMTAELLDRRYNVTALDRAPLDPRLKKRGRLTFLEVDAGEFYPEPRERWDAMLCDMNGESARAMHQIIRLAPALEAGALVVFTLKLPDAASVRAILAEMESVRQAAAGARLALVGATHLNANRYELTLFFERTGSVFNPAAMRTQRHASPPIS